MTKKINLKVNVFTNILNYLWYLWKRNNWMIKPGSFFCDFKYIPIKNPIFLLGVQGGGLTLLSRMLRRHPQVVSVSGNFKYWTGADEMHTVFGPILPKELTGTRFKVPLRNHPIFKPPRSWTYACDELFPYYRKTDEDATDEIKKKLEKIIRMCIARFAPDPMNARFIDKSQVFTVRVSLIRTLLKEYNPRFILVLNNPYAACYRAAMGKAIDMRKLQKKMNFKNRLKICAQHWENSIKAALRDKQKDMLIVRFEDLLLNTEQELKRICAHIDLDFLKDMIPSPYHKIPFGSRFRDRWYPLNIERALIYLKIAKKDEIQIIEERCGYLAKQFGYRPEYYKK